MSTTTEPNTTLIFVSLLTHCEGGAADLTDADAVAQECAEQMRDAGLMIEPQAGHFALSPKGMEALMLIEKLRDFALTRE